MTKKILIMMLERKIFGNDRTFDLIDEEYARNSGIKEISSPKGFSAIADWKGKNFLTFLLHYGLPFLNEYCRNSEILDNFRYLLNGVYYLSMKRITDSCIELASQEIENFLSTFVEIYGEQNIQPKVHELYHVVM